MNDYVDCPSKRHPKPATGYILVTVIIAHSVFVMLMFNSTLESRIYRMPEAVLQLLDVSPAKLPAHVEHEKPMVTFQLNAMYSKLPDVDINDVSVNKIAIVNGQSAARHELSNSHNRLYDNVFDPVLRKKLQEIHANHPEKQEAFGTQTMLNGTVRVDVGNGECMESMPNTNARERGTNWATLRVTCGKTESDNMMDNIAADLEVRKHSRQP